MYGDNRFGGGGRMTPPVKEGDEVDVTIEAVGEKGDGVAKVQGFVLFVANTQTGDNVKVRVTRVLSKVGFAEVIGKSDAPAAAPAQEAEPEEEFNPREDLDSEDFGEEGDDSGDDEPVDDSADDESDDEESDDDASDDEDKE